MNHFKWWKMHTGNFTHTHCKKWCKNLKCKKIQCKKEDNKNVSNLNDTQFVSELVKQHFYWWSLSNKSSTRFDKIKIFNKLFNRQRDVSASCWTIHSRVLNFLYTQCILCMIIHNSMVRLMGAQIRCASTIVQDGKTFINASNIYL